jgi:hypothetical protein
MKSSIMVVTEEYEAGPPNIPLDLYDVHWRLSASGAQDVQKLTFEQGSFV